MGRKCLGQTQGWGWRKLLVVGQSRAHRWWCLIWQNGDSDVMWGIFQEFNFGLGSLHHDVQGDVVRGRKQNYLFVWLESFNGLLVDRVRWVLLYSSDMMREEWCAWNHNLAMENHSGHVLAGIFLQSTSVCFSSHVKGRQWEEGGWNFLFNGPLQWEKVSRWVLERIVILDFFRCILWGPGYPMMLK